MKVRDILREKYTSFDVNDSLKLVATTFDERHVASAPVTKKGVYVGMISDVSIAKKFRPQKVLGIFPSQIPVAISHLKRMTAGELCERYEIFLTPNDDISDAMSKVIAKRYDCIPILDSKESRKLVGILRGSDITKLFLQYFATYEEGMKTRKQPMTEFTEVETLAGDMLARIEAEGSVPASVLAKDFSVAEETIEKIGAELERHSLLKITYRLLGGPVFKKAERRD